MTNPEEELDLATELALDNDDDPDTLAGEEVPDPLAEEG